MIQMAKLPRDAIIHYEHDGKWNINVTITELVRCKDCKYSDMTSNGLVKYCDIWFPDEQLYQDGDYYCADAELRGEHDDNRRL